MAFWDYFDVTKWLNRNLENGYSESGVEFKNVRYDEKKHERIHRRKNEERDDD
jgi:hypothetical protein